MPHRPDWERGIFAVLDTEATGVDARSARLIALALLEVEASGEVLPDGISTLVRPVGFTSPLLTAEASAVNGITSEEVLTQGAGAALLLQGVVNRLLEYAMQEIPVVCFNAPYHLRLLIQEGHRTAGSIGRSLSRLLHGTTLPDGQRLWLRVIDPLVLDRQIHPQERYGRRLGAMAARYGCAVSWGPANRIRHKWDADALMSERLARQQVVPGDRLDSLYRSQVVWHADVVRELRHYHTVTGNPSRAASVRDGWPIEGLESAGGNDVG